MEGKGNEGMQRLCHISISNTGQQWGSRLEDRWEFRLLLLMMMRNGAEIALGVFFSGTATKEQGMTQYGLMVDDGMGEQLVLQGFELHKGDQIMLLSCLCSCLLNFILTSWSSETTQTL